MKTTTLKLIPCLALSAMALAGQSARADLMTFDLTQPNAAVAGDPGPYVQVQVDLTSSTMATLTFTSLTTGGDIYLLGSGDAIGINVNATSWLVSNLTGNNSGTGFTPGPLSVGGSGNEDGFGVFNQQIGSFDGYTHSFDTISFTLTDTSGIWASAANVLTGNSQGDLAASHIYATAASENTANPAINTGFATSTGNSTSIPDGGSTMIMLGTALIGLAKARTWLSRQ